jgi:phosphoenolpyruvate carboxylase
MNTIDRGQATIDQDLPLKEDIRLLGRLLGDTLREQEGEETFNLIEQIRQTAIRFRRDGDTQARAELESALNVLTPAATVVVIRAFSYFSQLANIAEDLHINRRRRANLIAGAAGLGWKSGVGIVSRGYRRPWCLVRSRSFFAMR